MCVRHCIMPHPPWLVDGEDDVDAAARSVMVEEE